MPLFGQDRMGEVLADLSQIPKEVRRDLGPALKGAGEAVARDARARASWSGRIPGAISIRVLYGRRTHGVVIRVSRKKAPHARPYEGIGARRGNASSFRHPVFGGDYWVTQKTRPYLQPAAQAKAALTRRLVARVVEDAARRHGFQ